MLGDRDLAGEGAVCIGEITSNQEDTARPPHQADLKSVVCGFGARNRQRVDGIARGKHERIQAKDHAGQHAH